MRCSLIITNTSTNSITSCFLNNTIVDIVKTTVCNYIYTSPTVKQLTNLNIQQKLFLEYQNIGQQLLFFFRQIYTVQLAM